MPSKTKKTVTGMNRQTRIGTLTDDQRDMLESWSRLTNALARQGIFTQPQWQQYHGVYNRAIGLGPAITTTATKGGGSVVQMRPAVGQ